jgi:hypothetical protein
MPNLTHLNPLAILFFLIGTILHTVTQIDTVARSKNNPENSRIALLKSRLIPILSRTGCSLALFILWLQGELVTILGALNIPIPSAAKNLLDLHIGGAIAFLIGFSFDSMLAFIPSLNQAAPINPLNNGNTKTQ